MRQSEGVDQLLERYLAEDTYSFAGFLKLEVNTRGHEGETPLHMAVTREAIADVELLISAGADVDAKTAIGSTALHRACYASNRELVQLLMAAGADPVIADDFGTTANDIAQRICPELQALMRAPPR